MEHRSLLRLFGICSLIGGLLIALFQVWFYLDPISFVATYFDHVGWAFITFGFIGLYLVQYRQTGGLGFFSFLILSLGLFQWLGYKWFLTFAAPDLRRSVPELLDSGLQSVFYGVEMSNYFLQISFFLFAVITLFKGVLSRFGASLLLIGSATAFNAQMEEIIFYSPLVPQVLIGLAFAWLGYSLLRLAHDEHTYENDEQKEDMADQGQQEVNENLEEDPVSTIDKNVEASVTHTNVEEPLESEIETDETPNLEEKRQELSAT
ncbi:hypothetical protein [Niallia sp. Krafla_26]|uniref:hypothetical protein n=1 Tax=Niallia sp. Krafla_26 TaxID=3064703 RepID=UPI003D17044B